MGLKDTGLGWFGVIFFSYRAAVNLMFRVRRCSSSVSKGLAIV